MTTSHATPAPAMPALLELGQSIWLDYLRRGMIRSGELAGLIDAGLRGMTSNPTIFEQGIAGDDDYDEALARLATSGRTDAEIFEALAVEDVRRPPTSSARCTTAPTAATGSSRIEVSPGMARDTERQRSRRPAALAGGGPAQRHDQDPRHAGGLAGDRAVPAAGININITLLFSVEHYLEVAEAYLRGARGPGRAGRADRPGGIGRLVLREPGGHRSGCPARQDRQAGGEGAGRHRRHRQRPPGVRGSSSGSASARWRPGGEGRPGAAAALGQHRDQEPGVLRRALSRIADRSRHHHHRSAGNVAPVRRARHRGRTLAGDAATRARRMERLPRRAWTSPT